MSDDAFEVNGIGEQAFNSWKHHPVTKVFVRYLLDYERQIAERAIHALRNTPTAPDPFKSGVFQGEINAYAAIAELQFAELVEFYRTEEETDAT